MKVEFNYFTIIQAWLCQGPCREKVLQRKKMRTKIFVLRCNWEWEWQKLPEGALFGTAQIETGNWCNSGTHCSVLAHLCKYLDLGQQLLLLAGGAGIEKDLLLLCAQTCHTLLAVLCW